MNKSKLKNNTFSVNVHLFDIGILLCILNSFMPYIFYLFKGAIPDLYIVSIAARCRPDMRACMHILVFHPWNENYDIL